LAAQGFLAAHGFAASPLPLAVLSFVLFSAFLSFAGAHGFFAAQGFAAHGFFAWAKLKVGVIKNPAISTANIRRVTLFIVIIPPLTAVAGIYVYNNTWMIKVPHGPKKHSIGAG
jgi:hypothetical protein